DRRCDVARAALPDRDERRRECPRARAGAARAPGAPGVVSGTVGPRDAARRGGGCVGVRRVRPRYRAHRSGQADPPRRRDRERRGRGHAACGGPARVDRRRIAMKITKTYFMVMAADVARGANFYRKAFGLTTKYESPFWTELSADGATIALHHGGGDEARDTGLGFYVDDLEAACDAVKAAGGKIAKEPEDRTGEGIRLATAVDSGHLGGAGDPAGLPLALRERGLRGGLQRPRPRLHRPARRGPRAVPRQGGDAPRDEEERHAGHPRVGRVRAQRGRGTAHRRGDRLPGHAQGQGWRRRPGDAQGDFALGA